MGSRTLNINIKGPPDLFTGRTLNYSTPYREKHKTPDGQRWHENDPFGTTHKKAYPLQRISIRQMCEHCGKVFSLSRNDNEHKR